MVYNIARDIVFEIEQIVPFEVSTRSGIMLAKRATKNLCEPPIIMGAGAKGIDLVPYLKQAWHDQMSLQVVSVKKKHGVSFVTCKTDYTGVWFRDIHRDGTVLLSVPTTCDDDGLEDIRWIRGLGGVNLPVCVLFTSLKPVERSLYKFLSESNREFWSPVFYTAAFRCFWIRRLADAHRKGGLFVNTVTRWWVGVPNEHAPFRFHGAVVGFIDRSQ